MIRRKPPEAEEIHRIMELEPAAEQVDFHLRPIRRRQGRLSYAFLPWSVFRTSSRERFAWSRGRLSAEARSLDQKVQTPELLWRRGLARRRLGLADAAARNFEGLIHEKDSAQARFHLGACYAQSGRISQAAAQFDEALERDGSLWWARLWRAESCLRLGRFERGWDDLSICRKESPRSPLPFLVAGRHGRLEELDAAVELAPREPWGYFIRGWIRLLRGSPEQAQKDLSQGLELDPACRWAYLLRLRAREALGDSAAPEDLSRALALGPDLSSSLLSWQPEDPVPEEISFLNRKLDFQGCAWARAWRGQLYFDLLRPEAALEDLRRAVAEDPSCGWARAFLARAEAVWGGRFKEAVGEMTRAAADSPECGWIWAWRGFLIFKSGDLRGAAADYESALSQNPYYGLAYSWRAALRAQSGELEQALSDLDCAIELDPRYGANFEKRRRLRWQLGDRDGAFQDMECAVRRESHFSWAFEPGEAGYRQAIEGLSKVLVLRPSDAQALAHDAQRISHKGVSTARSRALAWRGETHLRFGRLAEARQDLEAALSLDPGFAWALAWRGETLRKLGEARQALRDLGRALKLDPGFACAYGWRARALLALGMRERAFKDLDLALRLDFGCAWAYAERGRLHLEEGRTRKAAQDLLRAACLDRSCAETRSLLEEALRLMGDFPREEHVPIPA